MTQHNSFNRFFKPLLITFSLLFSLPALAVDEINTTLFGNLAIKGYDPVAYFTESRPVEGSADFQYEWKGANWRFSSAENLASFQANPEQYAPQYGGYCAYAVAKNTTASIDPTQFTIVDDKLYLNFNKSINQKWLADRDNYIDNADQNWPALLAR